MNIQKLKLMIKKQEKLFYKTIYTEGKEMTRDLNTITGLSKGNFIICNSHGFNLYEKNCSYFSKKSL